MPDCELRNRAAELFEQHALSEGANLPGGFALLQPEQQQRWLDLTHDGDRRAA